MLKLGITGNIASGKSQAQSVFKGLSIPVIDADEIVNSLYSDKNFALKAEEKFFKYKITNDGKVDKNLLLKIIFDDLNFKKEFEKFVHTFVLSEIEKFFSLNLSENIVVASVPLLFETEWEKYFDKILLITADDEIRLERLMKRNSLSKGQALIRVNSQMPQDKKIKKADFVIENNSSLEELNEKIKVFVGSLK